MPFFNTIYRGPRRRHRSISSAASSRCAMAGTPYSELRHDPGRHEFGQSLDQDLHLQRNCRRPPNPPGGFVANSNNPPWTSAFPQPASTRSGELPDLRRAQLHGFPPAARRHLSCRASRSFYTTMQILAGEDVERNAAIGPRAARSDQDRQPAAANGGDTTAAAALCHPQQPGTTPRTPPASAACCSRSGGTKSSPDVHGRHDRRRYQRFSFYSPHPAFRKPWDPSQSPLTTPVGPRNPSNNAATAGGISTIRVQRRAAPTSPPQGGAQRAMGRHAHDQRLVTTIDGAHRTTLATHLDPLQQDIGTLLSNEPLSGADDDFGPIRVVNPVLSGRAGAIHLVSAATATCSRLNSPPPAPPAARC